MQVALPVWVGGTCTGAAALRSATASSPACFFALPGAGSLLAPVSPQAECYKTNQLKVMHGVFSLLDAQRLLVVGLDGC